MTDLLPVLPARADVLDVKQVERIERDVAARVKRVDDLDVLDEWRAQASALAEYLRGRELQAPMRGAQRRIEARIGQLLGEPVGRGHAEESTHAYSFARRADRVDFRTLALALDDGLLSDDEWRRSRRAVVKVIRERVEPVDEAALVAVPDRDPGKTRHSPARLFDNSLDNSRTSAAAARDRVDAAMREDPLFASRWLAVVDETLADLRAVRARLRRRKP